MIGRIYSKNLTFLQDQPFAENLLTGISYKKNKKAGVGAASTTRDSTRLMPLFTSDLQGSLGTQPVNAPQVLPKQQLHGVTVQAPTHTEVREAGCGSKVFGRNRVRNKSERMKKAEISLVKHFCLLLERSDDTYTDVSEKNLDHSDHAASNDGPAFRYLVGSVIPHLLVSVDSMRNTLLGTRGSRSPDRVKPPSQFKKTLRESRKVRLLYGNLSKRHISRATSKMHLSGENLLLWLESRLDVVLNRCGFFTTIKAARQSVLNGQIMVNSKVIRSPGFLLKGGDLIKVTQERLLSTSLNKQLRREVILSNKVFSRLVRGKKDVNVPSSQVSVAQRTALARLNRTATTLTQRNASASHSVPLTQRTAPAAGCVRVGSVGTYDTLPNRSFYTWLLKKQESIYQTGELLGRRHESLLSTNNWRFLGSPHLLFTFSFFHTLFKELISYVTQTLNKELTVEKKVRLAGLTQPTCLHSKAVQHSVAVLVSPCSSLPCLDGACTITPTQPASDQEKRYSTKKRDDTSSRGLGDLDYDGLIDTKKVELFLKVISQFSQKNKNEPPNVTFTQHLHGVAVQAPTRTSVREAGCVRSAYGVQEGPIPLGLHSGPHLTYTAQHRAGGRCIQAAHRPAMYERMTSDSVSVVAEIYSTLFSHLFPPYFDKDVFFSREKEPSTQLASIVERKDQDLLYVLLSDLLLYSLLIKKEILNVQIKKQLDSSYQGVSGVSAGTAIFRANRSPMRPVLNQRTNQPIAETGIDSGRAAAVAGRAGVVHGRQKASDLQEMQSDFRRRPAELATATAVGRRLPVDSSRVLADSRESTRSLSSKVSDKNIRVSGKLDLDKARRIKPLHLEVSYRSLCAVFLYPPQRVCLPVMIDIDCLVKSL